MCPIRYDTESDKFIIDKKIDEFAYKYLSRLENKNDKMAKICVV